MKRQVLNLFTLKGSINESYHKLNVPQGWSRYVCVYILYSTHLYDCILLAHLQDIDL